MNQVAIRVSGAAEMRSDLNEQQRALHAFMSELSEEAWHAGWMEDLEFELWRALVEAPFLYGNLLLNPAHVARLKQLSDACGGWIFFDDAREETFASADLWNCIYSARRSQWKATIGHFRTVMSGSFRVRWSG